MGSFLFFLFGEIMGSIHERDGSSPILFFCQLLPFEETKRTSGKENEAIIGPLLLKHWTCPHFLDFQKESKKAIQNTYLVITSIGLPNLLPISNRVVLLAWFCSTALYLFLAYVSLGSSNLLFLCLSVVTHVFHLRPLFFLLKKRENVSCSAKNSFDA